MSEYSSTFFRKVSQAYALVTLSPRHRGQQLYSDCAPLLESLGHSVNLAIDDEVKFKGQLTVSMPVRAGLDFLGNWLIDFASEHEELKLELSLSNVNLNLVKEDMLHYCV